MHQSFVLKDQNMLQITYNRDDCTETDKTIARVDKIHNKEN